MNRTLLLCGLAALTLLGGGCATKTVLEEPQVDAFANCDADWIARVEREARRHGSAIRWYRCPQFLPVKEPPPPFYYGDQRDA
jgi:hypothetical protein